MRMSRLPCSVMVSDDTMMDLILVVDEDLRGTYITEE
jgi:hypothetical protein